MGEHPTAEVVAVAWLKGLAGLHSAVATEVPADVSSWATYGFVQVGAVGGSPNPYLPLSSSIVGLDFWAAAVDSGRPPWGKASQLYEVVRAGTLDHAGAARTVTGMPSAYNGARVLSAWLITALRRVPGDLRGWAHYNADLRLDWVEVA